MLLLFCVLELSAQDYIHRDYYGRGTSPETALSSLMEQLEVAVPFDNKGLLETYRPQIEKNSIESTQGGRIQLSLKGSSLDAVFHTRQTRASGILEQGRAATDDSVKKTYYLWAWYYLNSLPDGYGIPGKDNLRQWLLAHSELSPSSLPVPMTHIEREVAQIKAVVGDIYAPAAGRKPSPEKEAIVTQPEEQPRVSAKELEKVEDARIYAPLDSDVPDSLSFVPSSIAGSSTQVPPLKTTVLFTSSFSPEFMPGLIVGLGNKLGGVLSVQTNFQTRQASYSALSSGAREDNGYIWPSGASAVSHFSIWAGPYFSLTDWLSIYAGGGYGFRNVYWEDTDGQWAHITDLSTNGVAISTGAIASWRHFSFTAGISTLGFATLGATFGIGLTF
ncbi:MAG: hypothetical protein IJU21_02030 [Bacteroidales bacterium]|nr:hypothetical protein [Bacteroidales bacterium]